MTYKRMAVLTLATLMVFTATSCKKAEPEIEVYTHPAKIESFEESKKLLREGNLRFVEKETLPKDITLKRLEKLGKDGQHPFAVIVSCSDSRVPPEIIFDQAVGDIFVVRTAGNVVDDVALGSIEYGAEHLGAKLIVVLGHSKCGAVKATVDGGKFPGSIGAIVKLIQPSLKEVTDRGVKADKRYNATENQNIRAMMDIIEKSKVIVALEEEDEVKVVGAKYDVDTGKVMFK